MSQRFLQSKRSILNQSIKLRFNRHGFCIIMQAISNNNHQRSTSTFPLILFTMLINWRKKYLGSQLHLPISTNKILGSQQLMVKWSSPKYKHSNISCATPSSFLCHYKTYPLLLMVITGKLVICLSCNYSWKLRIINQTLGISCLVIQKKYKHPISDNKDWRKQMRYENKVINFEILN